jgi:hypothetical protein
MQKGLFSPAGGGELTTPTAEPTDGETPTAEPTEEATVVPGGECVPEPALGLAVGDAVTLRFDAIVRESPGGTDTGRLGGNQPGTITAGPECARDLVWWEVTIESGESGWTAEQSEQNVPLILK